MFEDSPEKPFLKRRFGPIEDVETAEYVTSGIGTTWMLLGALNCVQFAFRSWAVGIAGGLLSVVLGFLIRYAKSRVGAVLLLSVTGLALVPAIAAVVRGGLFVYRETMLVSSVLCLIIYTCSAVRAVQVAFAYHRFKNRAAGPSSSSRSNDAVT